MELIAPNKGTFEKAPEGTHIARCYSIIDLGTQYSQFYKTSSHKILVGWELPTQLMPDERPFTVFKRYTLSLSENATLRKDLQSWRGKTFNDNDIAHFNVLKILGQCCMVNIAHGNDFANVQSVMALPNNMQCPPPINPTVQFVLNEFDQQVFDSLSDKLQDTIKQSQEYQDKFGTSAPPPAAGKPAQTQDDFDDDIPW